MKLTPNFVAFNITSSQVAIPENCPLFCKVYAYGNVNIIKFVDLILITITFKCLIVKKITNEKFYDRRTKHIVIYHLTFIESNQT